MDIISESKISGINIRYYNGFDIDKILKHPKDGTKGVMVVFFESIEQEEKKHNRNEIIISLLESKKINNFIDIIDSLNNPYLMLYQTHGYTDLVYKSIKNKIENIKDVPNWNIQTL